MSLSWKLIYNGLIYSFEKVKDSDFVLYLPYSYLPSQLNEHFNKRWTIGLDKKNIKCSFNEMSKQELFSMFLKNIFC